MKLAGAAVLVVLAFAACSKSNNVTRSERDLSTDNIGEACDANDAGFCGGGVCIAGRCRQKCGTDAECSGNICFVEAAGEQGGCRLDDEAACSTGEPCSTALLTCALDESCRIPCSDALPCPRNDQKCIAGSCFGSLEEGDKPWECETGSFRCSDDGKLQQCNTAGVGFVEVDDCETRELCDADAGECGLRQCDPSATRCEGRQLKYCDPAGDQPLVDEVCETEALCQQALNDELGACAEPACEPSDSRCEQGKLIACREDRTGFDEEVCASPGLCQLGLATGKCPEAECTPSALFCEGAELRRCDGSGSGSTVVDTCVTAELCEITATDSFEICRQPFCQAGPPSCFRGRELRQCNAGQTAVETIENCQDNGELCNPYLRRCEPLEKTPLVNVEVPGWTVPTYFIEEHEVTRYQYYQFMVFQAATAGNIFTTDGQTLTNWPFNGSCTDTAGSSGQPFGDNDADEWISLEPVGAPDGDGRLPMTDVDWCDADLYCRTIDRVLCESTLPYFMGDHFDSYDDPGVDYWTYVCTADGTQSYSYGDTYDANACNVSSTPEPVKSRDTCQSSASGFEGVYDLSGNVPEWTGMCTSSPLRAKFGDTCRVRGFDPDGGDPPEDSSRCSGNTFGDAKPAESWQGMGFRCCEHN